ncbi:D-hexose-6-phosphate mutarotase [Marinobacter sp. SS21]|uniref:D-hexose-6-phosphate mutarotase n=1 Tax=Marinobacter sp. SS21 TaxID=2979460 RepID=UPI00232DDC08|nr:D-hexose-6-phosphate mutarotase [Marinobacter sp. SS21]MDC0661928.1 D-hexose-6-phosphate mutarotase [Marinobacter sp. SS21]
MRTIPGQWSFTRWTSVEQLEALDVRHPLFSARLFLQGAHLTHFAPTGHANWLWLSDSARFETGRAIRGGIPICWPWFGVPDRNPPDVRETIRTRSAHGFARNEVWQLEEVVEATDSVEISLSLLANDDFKDRWRGHASALLTFRFTRDACQIALTTTNLGQSALAFSQALHSYLPAAISDTVITGLDGASYTDTLKDWAQFRQQGDVTFPGEVDRIYQTGGEAITVHSGSQCLHLTSSGSCSAVIWNPGPDKARQLSDFSAQDWKSMVCVETANVLHDFRLLNSGQSHTLGVMITRSHVTKEHS